MGKKIKTLDSAAPTDIFDKLAIESHQVPTVVLMLDSPEEEVVIKASRALYKFAEKCDENKEMLLTMNLTEKLLILVQHEELKIRKNACSTIGSMSRHPEARKFFKKLKNLIPAMVQLLIQEFDLVIKEYASLCLSALAVDFSAKITICTYGGLIPLVDCLGCSDPDVQKNCIETIALMCQDYETKALLREASGLGPILELLKSTYPVIQYHALLALQLASEDCDNRSALFDVGILPCLLEYLSKPECKNLHVFAIMVLSNCLDNDRVLQAVKDYGLLQKLIALITDENLSSPSADDLKTQAVGKKEKPVKDSKKSRIEVGGGDGGASDENKGPADPIIPVMPELKEQVAKAIAVAVKNTGNQKILHEQDVEKKLITMITGAEKPPTQTAAAYALSVLSQHVVSRDCIGKLAGIPPLVKLAKFDNPDVSEAVAMAFANLTTDDNFNCGEVVNGGGLEPLIVMLSKPRELTIANVTSTLNNLASQEQFRSEIIRLNAVPALAECLKSESALVQGKVTACLAALLVDRVSRSQFMNSAGLEQLVKLVQSNDNIVRMNSSWALSCLANDDAIVPALFEQGVLPLLWAIENSATRRNAFSTHALSKLLDYNITLRYALTGELGTNNVIPDEFYDPGRIDDLPKLKTLEEHSQYPINQRRPIILVNPKPEKSIAEITPQVSEVELTEKAGKAGSTGRSSRAGKDLAKPRRSTMKDKEADKSKDDEGQQQAEKEAEKSAAEKEVVPFAPYCDSKLLRYIEEAIEAIYPLPTSKDQIVALANFVSDKLGGAVNEGELDCYAWEDDMAQLKDELQSNIIPLGLVRLGFYYHRALLFKILADKVGVQSTLRRGDYNRAWNEVFIASETEKAKPYIVDVHHRPGRLINLDCCDALAYQKLH